MVVVQPISCVQHFVTPQTAACQAPLSSTISQNLLKPMSIKSGMQSNHLILCCSLLLPSVFPSIRVFSNELALCIRWSKYWSFSISPSNEYSVLIFFRIDWFDIYEVKWRSEVKVAYSCQIFATPWAIQSMEFSRPEYWNGQPFPSPGDLPNPGIDPRSYTLQVDSLPVQPQDKCKNTGMGSLSLLQQIFMTQESNQGHLHCRQILYQLSYEGSLWYVFLI